MRCGGGKYCRDLDGILNSALPFASCVFSAMLPFRLGFRKHLHPFVLGKPQDVHLYDPREDIDPIVNLATAGCGRTYWLPQSLQSNTILFVILEPLNVLYPLL